MNITELQLKRLKLKQRIVENKLRIEQLRREISNNKSELKILNKMFMSSNSLETLRKINKRRQKIRKTQKNAI